MKPKWYQRRILQIIGVFILVFLVLVVGDTAREWWARRKVDQLAAGLEQYAAETNARRAADTIGGATPQETLEMYILAVEAGDYELASSYFVEEKREGELKRLEGSPVENLENVTSLLQQVSFSDFKESDRYIARDPIFVEFVLYPSGNWKIVEI